MTTPVMRKALLKAILDPEKTISTVEIQEVTLGPKLTADPRCRFLHGDFFALAMSAGGFESGRRYHAVLLDIDHSPGDLLHERHGAFYSVTGLRAMAAHLHPGPW